MIELSDPIQALSKKVGGYLRTHQLKVMTVESCTGGGLAFAITSVPGSSEWFEQGLVTYSNASKTRLLHIPSALIEKEGAVSESVARLMAENALDGHDKLIALSVTGIAGPDGGTSEKPVGTVWIAHAGLGETITQLHHFSGDRQSIREQAIIAALTLLLS